MRAIHDPIEGWDNVVLRPDASLTTDKACRFADHRARAAGERIVRLGGQFDEGFER